MGGGTSTHDDFHHDHGWPHIPCRCETPVPAALPVEFTLDELAMIRQMAMTYRSVIEHASIDLGEAHRIDVLTKITAIQVKVTERLFNR